MASYTGKSDCRVVEGSTYSDRLSFDQSVPYTLSNSGYFYFLGTGTYEEKSHSFSLVLPAKNDLYDVSQPAVQVSLQKQVAVSMKGLRFYGSSMNPLRIQVAVCDPSSFPTADDTVMLVDELVYGDFDVSFPDIRRFVIVAGVSQPLNVVVRFSGTFGDNGGTSTYCRCKYRCILDIDD